MDLSSIYIPTAGQNMASFMITQHQLILSRSSILKGTANLKLGKSVICHNAMLRGDLGVVNAQDYVIFSDGVIVHPCYQKKKQ
jgi:carbonic anhydrase/acetyltransferase-like protein (isoleucine patch superfamily)